MSEGIARAISFGADIEVFVRDIKTKEIVPSRNVEYIKGSLKDKPISRQLYSGKYIKLHPDNIALEFATPVCPSPEHLIDSIGQSFYIISKGLRSQGLEICPFISEAEFAKDWLAKTPGADEFGCNPDVNIYTGTPSEFDPSQPWRFCGGHIHVGLEKGWTMGDVGFRVNQLDKGLGVYLNSLEKKYTQGMRVKVYGKPGTIREKPYGFEYRTPSNLWTMDELIRRRVRNYLWDLTKW